MQHHDKNKNFFVMNVLGSAMYCKRDVSDAWSVRAMNQKKSTELHKEMRYHTAENPEEFVQLY